MRHLFTCFALASVLAIASLSACVGNQKIVISAATVATGEGLSPFNLVLDMAGWEATDGGRYRVGGHEFGFVVAKYLNGASPNLVWKPLGVSFDAVVDSEHLVMMRVVGRPVEEFRVPLSYDENQQPVALQVVVCMSLDHQPLGGQSPSTTSVAPIFVTGGKVISHTLSPRALADENLRTLEEGAVRSLSDALDALERSARKRTVPDRWDEFIRDSEAHPVLRFDNTSQGRTHWYPEAIVAITKFMSERYGIELPGRDSTFYPEYTYRATPLEFGKVAVWMDLPAARYAGKGVIEGDWERDSEQRYDWMGDGSWLAKMIESDPNRPEGEHPLPDPEDDVYRIHRQLLFFCSPRSGGHPWHVSQHGVLESVSQFQSRNAHAKDPPRLDHRFLSLGHYHLMVFSSNQRATLLWRTHDSDRLVSKEFYRPMWSHSAHTFAAHRPFFGDTFPEHINVYPLLHPDLPVDAAAGIDSTIVTHDSRLWMSGRIPSVIVAEEYTPVFYGPRGGFSFKLEHARRGQGPYRMREFALPSGHGPVGMLLPVWVGGEAGVIAVTEGFLGEPPIDESEYDYGRAYLVLPSKELVCSVELTERAKRLFRDLDRGFYHDKDAIRHAPQPGRPNRFLARLEGGAAVRDQVIEIELRSK